MNHIVEGVRQIRGESTSQVPGAEVCLVTSTPLPPGSALILRARVTDQTDPAPAPGRRRPGHRRLLGGGPTAISWPSGSATHCAAVLHMPRAYCHTCGSWKSRWEPGRGRGRLYSWTTVEHQVHPAFPVPYTVVLVELDDHPGVRLIGYLRGAPGAGRGAGHGGVVRNNRNRRRPAPVGTGVMSSSEETE